MHHLIEEIIEDLARESSERECNVNIKLVGKEGYLVSHENAQKVVAVGIINIRNDDDEVDKIVGAFTIDVRKYAWAEAEGFTQDQMIDELNDQIFTLIGIDEVIAYICDD